MIWNRSLERLSTRFSTNEKFKDYDSDLIKLLDIIQEFESKAFNGSEFIASDLGKLFKTIHYLLVKNKARLTKTVLLSFHIFSLKVIREIWL